jgi:hypothetical protein
MIYSMDTIRVNLDSTVRIENCLASNLDRALASEDFQLIDSCIEQKCDLVRKFAGNELSNRCQIVVPSTTLR